MIWRRSEDSVDTTDRAGFKHSVLPTETFARYGLVWVVLSAMMGLADIVSGHSGSGWGIEISAALVALACADWYWSRGLSARIRTRRRARKLLGGVDPLDAQAWWALEPAGGKFDRVLEGLSAEEREYVMALAGEFDGTLGELIETARRM